MGAQDFTIHIDPKTKQISVTPKGGNGRFKETALLGWDGGKDDPFTLQFFAYDSGKQVPAEPFEGCPNTVTTPFRGTLKRVSAGQDLPAYSYTISKPGSQPLDPIIIVDRN
jgi:hypothetical protein